MLLSRVGAFYISVFFLFASPLVNAVSLHVDSGGILTGADNVLIDGSLYNVSLVEGTCADVFNGCDDSSDFFFKTRAEATLAGQALLDQVFVDGVDGNFDSDITSIYGCELATIVCVGLVTYQDGLLNDPSGLTDVVMYTRNFEAGQSEDNVGATTWESLGGLLAIDTSINPGGNPNLNGDRLVWAVYSEVAPVPVPAAIWLFGSGLLGLIGVARPKKAE